MRMTTFNKTPHNPSELYASKVGLLIAQDTGLLKQLGLKGMGCLE